MSDTVISVENLSKRYIIRHQAGANGHGHGNYLTLRDILADAATAPLRGLRASMKRRRPVTCHDPNSIQPSSSGLSTSKEDFWALTDVSFEVRRGEVLGIIGKNGAGKSTILKILSRITEPTKGRVRIKGRVASLLEVGTGFHPELTGRENIYLNGAILGMTRAEIRRKFDEIVDFADTEKFLDTPVKRYSSGMYVRLAFAVAAHLEPEVLIVDEVLAVGDAEFQKKCLGKMKDVAGHGRTVIFVSHNMAAIRSLCSRGLLFAGGHLQANSIVHEILKQHITASQASAEFRRPNNITESTTITHGSLEHDELNQQARLTLIVTSSEEVNLSLDIRMTDMYGAPIAFGSLGTLDAEQEVRIKCGTNKLVILMNISNFATGTYYLSLDLSKPFIKFYDRAEQCLTFEIKDGGRSSRCLSQIWGLGSFNIPLKQL